MSASSQHETPRERLEFFSQLISTGSLADVSQQLSELHPAEISHLLEALPRDQRDAVWQLVSPEVGGDVLLHVNDELRTRFIRDMDEAHLVTATKDLDTDDLVDILPDLPDNVSANLLESLDDQYRQRLESVMSFAEDSAGGLMNIDTITVRANISLDVVIRYLRLKGEIPAMTDNLIVVDRSGHYLGSIALTDLITKDPEMRVSDVLSTHIEPIEATTHAREVANLFEQRDLITAPVVDGQGKILGRITIDDVVDVIRDEADHTILSRAGLSESDDMFAPVIRSSQRRALWLAINLLTALLASWVISHFDQTIERLVALAILMPIVASMGGIAGSQTLTLVIRGIALGQVGGSNYKRLINKELLVGVLNGSLWAIIIAGIAYLWFHDINLSYIIAIAILLNLVVAALAGASIPLILHKLGIDPALAGGVLLTTITDVVGFLAFLGLAALLII